jgi:hypothetical protein
MRVPESSISGKLSMKHVLWVLRLAPCGMPDPQSVPLRIGFIEFFTHWNMMIILKWSSFMNNALIIDQTQQILFRHFEISWYLEIQWRIQNPKMHINDNEENTQMQSNNQI